jgi:hypothetical protein
MRPWKQEDSSLYSFDRELLRLDMDDPVAFSYLSCEFDFDLSRQKGISRYREAACILLDDS